MVTYFFVCFSPHTHTVSGLSRSPHFFKMSFVRPISVLILFKVRQTGAKLHYDRVEATRLAPRRRYRLSDPSIWSSFFTLRCVGRNSFFFFIFHKTFPGFET